MASPTAVYLYIRQAGWTGADAVAATAVALAESSGDENATSSNPDGGTNVGLFQLDTPGGKGAGYSIAQLKDPALNARVAYAGWVADGRTFTKHWATATNGAAAAQHDAAMKAATDSGAPPTGSAAVMQQLLDVTNGYQKAVEAPVTAITSTLDVLKWFTDPTHWLRIAYGVVGAALVVVGLNAVAKPVTAPVVATGKKIAKTAAVAAAA